MAFRLRHVQSVTLKHFDPGTQGQRLPRDALLHYELWRGGPDCEQQLLYVSEQVPLDFDLCWQPLSAAKCCVPPELLHQPFTDLLHLTIRAVQPGSSTSSTAEPSTAHTQQLVLQDEGQQQQQQHQQQEEAQDLGEQNPNEKLVLVRYIDGAFRVLLPWQLSQLLQQQQQHEAEEQQQQQQQQSHSGQQDAAAVQQAVHGGASIAAAADDRPVRVHFDTATCRFKVLVVQAPLPSLVHQDLQQQQQSQTQPQPQPHHAAAVSMQPDRWQLSYNSSGRGRLLANPGKQRGSSGGGSATDPQQQHDPTSPVMHHQQHHISWSPSVQAAAAVTVTGAAASPSHAAVVRARQARHSRTSSGCSSDAALQLEQQLLEVFTVGSMSGGSMGSSSGAAAAPPQSTAAAAAAAAAAASDSSRAAGCTDRSAWHHQQEELLPASGQHGAGPGIAVDTAGAAAAASAAGDGAPDACVALQGNQHHTSLCAEGHRDSTTDLGEPQQLPPNTSAAKHAAMSLAGKGRLLLHFAFLVHDLCVCDPSELKTLAPGGPQNPAAAGQLSPNKLLLQLTGGLYTLPPQPQAPHPAVATDRPELSPMHSADDWVGPEGFDSMRLGLAGRQLSGQMAVVAQQQQLYRWMLSSSTGIFDSLDHSFDEEEVEQQQQLVVGGRHSRASSAGGSSASTMSLLGALFNRRSPQVVAPLPAAGVGSAAGVAAAYGDAGGVAAAAGAAASASGQAAGALSSSSQHAGLSAGQAGPQVQRLLLPSNSSVASLTADEDTGGGATAAGSAGSSSPQHPDRLSIGGALAATYGGSSSGSRHRRTGSSTATSTAVGMGPGGMSASVAAAGAGAHRRAQSVSSGGHSWTLPYPKTPLSPAAASAAAAAAASGGETGAYSITIASPTASPAAATTPTAAASAAAGAAGPGAGAVREPSSAPSATTSSSRLADSMGGSSTAAAATATPAAAAAAATPGPAASSLGLLQRGFLSGFSFWDWGSADDTAGLSAAGTPSERAAVERQYEVDEFVAVTRRLITLHQRLHQVVDRRNRVRHRVEALLQQQSAARQQQQRRHAAQQQQQVAATLAAVRQQQLSHAAAVLQAHRKQVLARCEGVVEAAGALAQASNRLCEASTVLEGPEGLGQWKQLHAHLVARRNKLVVQLGQAFQVGPASRSPFAAAPLALQLDASWWAVDADTAAEAASDSGGDLQQQQQQSLAAPPLQQTQRFPAAASGFAQAPVPQQQQQQRQQLQVHQPVHQLLSNSQQQQPQQQPGSPAAPDPKSPAVDRLLVGGLELPSSLSKRGLQGSMGWGGDLDEEARVAAALGYVASIVSLLSTHLDVPLRYPLLVCSSRSMIIDPAPVHSQSLETHVHRRFWGLGYQGGTGTGGSSSSAPVSSSMGIPAGSTSPRGGEGLPQQQQQRAPYNSPRGSPAAAAAASGAAAEGGAAGAAAAAAGGEDSGAPLQLPLFYMAGDRTRFAYAVFLLNKDIEQLLHAHGMSSQGPSQVLGNLYKLVTAAASGIPQQQPQQQPLMPPLQQQQHARDCGNCSSSSNNGPLQQAAPVVAAAGAAAAADRSAGGVQWLQQLPLPPGHNFQPQQGQQHDPLGTAGGVLQQQQQQQAVLKQQQQPSQQQRGFWRWPWQGGEGQQQDHPAVMPAVASAPSPNRLAQQQHPQQHPQQQQQQAIATWDWNELLAESPAAQQQAGMQGKQQQQQQQQQHLDPASAGSNGCSSAFDAQAWHMQSDAQLQAAHEAARAASAAAAAAEKAADAAARMMSQEAAGGGSCRRQHGQPDGSSSEAASLNNSRSVASLLSLKWAGDGG